MSLYDEDNLPHTVRHERNTYTRDLDGADLEGREVIAAERKCWVQNASRAETNEHDKRDETVTHKVYFGRNPQPRVGDYFIVIDGPSHVGEELKYQSASDRSAGLGVLFGALCELETNPRYATFS